MSADKKRAFPGTAEYRDEWLKEPYEKREDLFREAWHRLKERAPGIRGVTWSASRMRQLMGEVWEEVTNEAVARRQGGTDGHGAG